MMLLRLSLTLLLLCVVSTITVPTSASPAAPDQRALFDKEVQTVFGYDATDVFDNPDDDSDDDDKDDGQDALYDDKAELEGVKLSALSASDFGALVDEYDNLVVSQLDLLAGTKELQAKYSNTQARRKRWVPLALGAIRAARVLFSAARAGRVTSSGLRMTRQYARPGNFRTAVQDFHRFGASNTQRIGGRYSGRTGTIGNHRITVRSGSSRGPATLEIRSPRTGGRTYVRKFRYE